MKNKLIFFLLPFVFFLLSGCVKINTSPSGKASNLGGVFKTTNKGDSWVNVSLIANTSGKPVDFSSTNGSYLAIDPSDANAVYFGAVENGLFYSFDGGTSWQIAKALGKGTVRSIAVDPKDKCTIYVSRGNKVFKSIDCNRTWDQVYQDTDINVMIDSLLVDGTDNKIVYFSTSRGDFVRSGDAGASWHTAERFNDRIIKFVLNQKKSKEVYAATKQKGVFKTNDGGDNWERIIELDKALKDNKINYNAKDLLLFNGENKKIIYVVVQGGLMKSVDDGETWEMIELIPPQSNVLINAFEINPKNELEMYYVTNTTFYRSNDGGTNWTTLPLPTSRAGWMLAIDPGDTNVMYLGVTQVSK